MKEIWIEAESLPQKGGWVVDTTGMEMRHSAYLMAHGMGIPVADATGSFTVEEAGTYHVWALTRDWTAVWDVKDPAGKFTLSIDAAPLPQILGTNGKDWAWQKAGDLFLEKGSHTLHLHDLTGFNGRCDAVYITSLSTAPDSTLSAIDALRKRLCWKEISPVEKVYDLVVVGGGIAGICTAIAASRSGISVALIHDRAVLGGCNSSEVRVCQGGQIKLPPYEKLGNVVQEIAPVMGHPTLYRAEYFEDMRKLFAFEVPSYGAGKCDLYLETAVTDLEKTGDAITAVICTHTLTGKKTRLQGKLFSDCSGDGILCRLAGAEWMYGNDSRETFGESLAPEQAKKLVMGQSIRWYSVEENGEVPFPELDWNLPFDDNNYLNCISGDWEQETGFTRDMVTETEYIRDYGLRAIYANWSFQKHHCKDKSRFANRKLQWVSPIGGKREGYRIKGDYILTQRDMEKQISHPDGTAKITWGIDIHYPEPINAEQFGEAFRSFAYHRNIPAACAVPYRCLYSKDVANLFLGGRLISASHVAFSAIRVMRTLGMLGEVVGMAAALCVENSCDPRQIYTHHLDALKEKMTRGIPIPAAFACGGIGNGESYHFKDICWWYLHNGKCADHFHQPREAAQWEIDKFTHCVDALGIDHKYPIPENWESPK